MRVQMTRACFMEWNSTMTCWWKPDHSETSNPKCFYRRTRKHLHSSKDGPSLGRFTLMVMSASFHLLMHIRFYQTLPEGIQSYFLCWQLLRCWWFYSSADLIPTDRNTVFEKLMWAEYEFHTDVVICRITSEVCLSYKIILSSVKLQILACQFHNPFLQ